MSDEWWVIPLYEGWTRGEQPIERVKVVCRYPEEAAERWHREHPWGVHGAIYRIEEAK